VSYGLLLVPTRNDILGDTYPSTNWLVRRLELLSRARPNICRRVELNPAGRQFRSSEKGEKGVGNVEHREMDGRYGCPSTHLSSLVFQSIPRWCGWWVIKGLKVPGSLQHPSEGKNQVWRPKLSRLLKFVRVCASYLCRKCSDAWSDLAPASISHLTQ
jgi:hypothetical protein